MTNKVCSTGLCDDDAVVRRAWTALLTKYVFTHVDTPVAFSVLSCIATIIVILPVFIVKPSLFGWIKPEMLIGFIGCSGAIAVDLGCTNVAISELSVAMQQTSMCHGPVEHDAWPALQRSVV